MENDLGTSQFEKDLEFIQLLCNPDYLKWLFDNDYFLQHDFLEYLKYLKYFNTSKYKVFLMYPQCLNILDLLLDENRIEILENNSFYKELKEKQYFLWKNNK